MRAFVHWTHPSGFYQCPESERTRTHPLPAYPKTSCPIATLQRLCLSTALLLDGLPKQIDRRLLGDVGKGVADAVQDVELGIKAAPLQLAGEDQAGVEGPRVVPVADDDHHRDVLREQPGVQVQPGGQDGQPADSSPGKPGGADRRGLSLFGR